MSETKPALEEILLAGLFAADHALSLEELADMFELGDDLPRPEPSEIKEALMRAQERLAHLPLEIRKLAGGYRLEVPQAYSMWVSRLWVERPARYSRALLETLALIAYRQPITRPEIEQVRGVAVSTNIIRTLTERGWVRVVGHRDAPGRPALYGTTRGFLDYFGLASLEDLPTLAEIRELSEFEPELPLEETEGEISGATVGVLADEEGIATEQSTEPGGEVVRGPWRPDAGTDQDGEAEPEHQE